MSTDISFIDTTLRDGNQSLWGAAGITTPMVRDVLPMLAEANYKGLEFITSTHMAMSVRIHREDPWERIRTAAEALPDVPLGFLTTGLRFISWDRMPPEIMQLAIRLLVKNGIRRFWVMDPLNDMAAALEVAAMVKAAGDVEVIMGVVYTDSPVHTDQYYARRTDEIAGSPHVDSVYLKDVGGLLTPERTRALVPIIKSRIGDRVLEMHSHCSTGLAPLCYLEAVKHGVTVLHTATPPLANGSSQPSVLNVAHNLRQLGYGVALNEEPIEQISEYFKAVAERGGLATGVPLEYDVSYYAHQVPGGMMGTLRRQLGEMGMEHRLGEVLDEVATVRRELGYPIMVTPFSQFMAAQSLMNVVSKERYSMVPNEIVQYALGRFGTPPVPIDPEVLDRVMASPSAAAIAEAPPELSLDDYRRRFGRSLTDEDLLLRITMPAEQMDAMVAARSKPAVEATSAARPLMDLLTELQKRRKVVSLQVRKGDFALDVRRPAS
jgi:oxaloacetate decarboxylase alpha subunit